MLAQEESRDLNDAFIGTEHILLGLLREADGLAAKTLESLGVTYVVVRERVHERSDANVAHSPGAPPFSPRAKNVLELALRESIQLGHSYVGTEHLLLGLVREGNGVASEVLLELGIELSLVRAKVTELMSEQPARESAASSTGGRSNSALLHEVVRAVGQQLRPDLGATDLEDLTSKIAERLSAQLEKSWLEPDEDRPAIP